MKSITLTNSKDTVKVSDEDYDFINQWKWRKTFYGYAVRNESRLIGHKLIPMHAQIIGTPKGMDTDHINGDKLDNRRENLRVCARTENMMNRGKQKNNTSGYKGVSWCNKDKRWVAQIAIDKKMVRLGGFINPIDAAKKYDEFAKKHYGTFAITNFAQEE